MHPNLRVARVGLFLLAGTGAHGPARAEEGEATTRHEVLAGVDGLFQAMARHDVAAARRLLMPGASFVVKRPDGRVAMEHDSDFLAALATAKGVWRERIWSPTVLVQGELAQVWAPYDFHLDGAFLHCGVDSFSLVRDGDRWRIAGISYTVRKRGCPPSPLDRAASLPHR